jgi:hypothetical protein
MRRTTIFFLALFMALLATPRDAMAYLDPAYGSVIVQLLAGGLVGGFVMMKMYWSRIKRALGLERKKEPKAEPETPEKDEEKE